MDTTSMSREEERDAELARALARQVNLVSRENVSDTPDFILGEFMVGALRLFEKALKSREEMFPVVVVPQSVEGIDELLLVTAQFIEAHLDIDHKYLLEDIRKRYAEPQRRYHNLEHLVHGLREFGLVLRSGHPHNHESMSKESKALLLLAWLMHDAVYDPTRKDNEELSVELLASYLRAGGRDELIDQGAMLILATKHTASPLSLLECLLLDIDLVSLAAPWPVFEKNNADIRLEYAHVPELELRRARRAFMESLLARKTIYHTGIFIAQYEGRARLNIQHLLQFEIV